VRNTKIGEIFWRSRSGKGLKVNCTFFDEYLSHLRPQMAPQPTQPSASAISLSNPTQATIAIIQPQQTFKAKSEEATSHHQPARATATINLDSRSPQITSHPPLLMATDLSRFVAAGSAMRYCYCLSGSYSP
jgi:hypothetical protein